MAAGTHPFPFRTRQLRPPAPMVLGGNPPGRVSRRRVFSLRRRPPAVAGVFAYAASPPTEAKFTVTERKPRRPSDGIKRSSSAGAGARRTTRGDSDGAPKRSSGSGGGRSGDGGQRRASPAKRSSSAAKRTGGAPKRDARG